jgi:hypothetical protein
MLTRVFGTRCSHARGCCSGYPAAADGIAAVALSGVCMVVCGCVCVHLSRLHCLCFVVDVIVVDGRPERCNRSLTSARWYGRWRLMLVPRTGSLASTITSRWTSETLVGRRSSELIARWRFVQLLIVANSVVWSHDVLLHRACGLMVRLHVSLARFQLCSDAGTRSLHTLTPEPDDVTVVSIQVREVVRAFDVAS